MTIRASKPHANEVVEKAPPALIALVQLLARQTAREALANTSSTLEQHPDRPLNSSGNEDDA